MGKKTTSEVVDPAPAVTICRVFFFRALTRAELALFSRETAAPSNHVTETGKHLQVHIWIDLFLFLSQNGELRAPPAVPPSFALVN